MHMVKGFHKIASVLWKRLICHFNNLFWRVFAVSPKSVSLFITALTLHFCITEFPSSGGAISLPKTGKLHSFMILAHSFKSLFIEAFPFTCMISMKQRAGESKCICSVDFPLPAACDMCVQVSVSLSGRFSGRVQKGMGGVWWGEIGNDVKGKGRGVMW